MSSLNQQIGSVELSKLGSYAVGSFTATTGSGATPVPVVVNPLYTGPGRNIEPETTGFTAFNNEKDGLVRLNYVLFVRNPTAVSVGEVFRFRTILTSSAGVTPFASSAYFPAGLPVNTPQRFPAQLYFRNPSPGNGKLNISFEFDASTQLAIFQGNVELLQLPTPLEISASA